MKLSYGDIEFFLIIGKYLKPVSVYMDVDANEKEKLSSRKS